MRKNYYYVLVFTDCGPVYVTSTGKEKTAYWDALEKPLALPRYKAEQIAMGLNLNFYTTVIVLMPYELENQPYLYDKFQIKWEERENIDEY